VHAAVRLPVFPITATAPPERLVESLLVGEGLAHADSPSASELSFASGPRRLTIDLGSGDIWSAIPSRLWKPRLSHREPVRGDATLFTIRADEMPAPFWEPFRAPGLESRLVRTAVSGTRAIRMTLQPRRRMPHERHVVVLDSHHSYTTEIRVPDPEASASRWVPLTGAGVRLGVTHDLQGRVIGLHRSMPRSDAAPIWSRIVPVHASVQALREMYEHLDLLEPVQSMLAYDACATCAGRFLRPVWVHAATVRIGQTVYQLPISSLPATEFGPETRAATPPPAAAAAHDGHARRRLRHDLPTARLSRARLVAGGWWADERLPHARTDVEAFARHVHDANVHVIPAHEEPGRRADWLENASAGVESADLAFFAGHATFRGWAFRDRQELAFTDLWQGEGATLFGRDRLKWIAVAGCGPLQDRVIDAANGGNAIRRWWRAFSGLHTLCGFATQTGDRAGMGERFARLLKTEPVIDAWFRAAREGQVSGSVSAAVLYASSDGEDDPLEDRLGPDPRIASVSREPDTFTAIWTAC
jgi:hypothetical protein